MGSTLTRKGLATRQRIVAGAAELFRARGVAGTSLDDDAEHCFALHRARDDKVSSMPQQ